MMLSAIALSHTATCRRRGVGCILTSKKYVVATGFNGSPKGLSHCLESGCLLNDLGHCINCVHAEANAVMRCKEADTAYCTDQPCINCLKLLLQKGVKWIYYFREYNDADTNIFLTHHFGGKNQWPLLKYHFEPDGLLSNVDSRIKEYLQGV